MTSCTRLCKVTTALSLLLAASAAASEGPCDILAAAGNPCVAAHSTVRSLYAAYAGPLYRVVRPNNASANVSVLEPGGFAAIAVHEQFCAAGDCVIANIYDQSPQGNHLAQRISDGVVHKMGKFTYNLPLARAACDCLVSSDRLLVVTVNASKHKISVGPGGKIEVFGMWCVHFRKTFPSFLRLSSCFSVFRGVLPAA